MQQALDVFFTASWGFYVTIGLGIALVIAMQLLGWPTRARARFGHEWHAIAVYVLCYGFFAACFVSHSWLNPLLLGYGTTRDAQLMATTPHGLVVLDKQPCCWGEDMDAEDVYRLRLLDTVAYTLGSRHLLGRGVRPVLVRDSLLVVREHTSYHLLHLGTAQPQRTINAETLQTARADLLGSGVAQFTLSETDTCWVVHNQAGYHYRLHLTTLDTLPTALGPSKPRYPRWQYDRIDFADRRSWHIGTLPGPHARKALLDARGKNLLPGHDFYAGEIWHVDAAARWLLLASWHTADKTNPTLTVISFTGQRLWQQPLSQYIQVAQQRQVERQHCLIQGSQLWLACGSHLLRLYAPTGQLTKQIPL